jgi:hypothetical protein
MTSSCVSSSVLIKHVLFDSRLLRIWGPNIRHLEVSHVHRFVCELHPHVHYMVVSVHTNDEMRYAIKTIQMPV